MDSLVSKMTEWRRRIHGAHARVTKCRVETLKDGMERLGPLTWPPDRELLLQTKAEGWTAYFANGRMGSDPVTAVGYLSGELKLEALVITCIPSGHQSYRALQFMLYGQQAGYFLNLQRALSYIVDGKRREFTADGEPLPFEDVSTYSRRKVSERFTREHLVAYCKAVVNDDVFAKDFYGGDAAVFER